MIRKMSAAFAFAILASVYTAAQEARPASAQEAKPSPVRSQASRASGPEAPDAAAQAPIIITVADTAAPQEWEVSVPIAAKLATGTQVGRLSLKLVYSSKVLKYDKVKSTDTLKGAGFEVTANTPVIAGETGTLPLEFKATPAAAGAKGIPTARIAIVVFKVVKDAEEKTWPMTTKDVEAWAFGNDASPVKAASGPPAKFVVSPAGLPIFGCFFYALTSESGP